METSRKRWIFYVVVLAVLGGIAFWLFQDKDEYQDLKKTEQVTEGLEEPVAFVKKTVKLIDEKDRRKLFSVMASKDGVEFSRITDLVFGNSMSPVEILGARRMTVTSNKDNLAIYVKSQSRDKVYLFHLSKGKNGTFRLGDIELTEHGPVKES